jgi:hypothetical protein
MCTLSAQLIACIHVNVQFGHQEFSIFAWLLRKKPRMLVSSTLNPSTNLYAGLPIFLWKCVYALVLAMVPTWLDTW